MPTDAPTKAEADARAPEPTNYQRLAAHLPEGVWKSVARGAEKYVLVLEDDVWFRPGARRAIDRAWRAALRYACSESGPRLVYLSYSDADGTADGIRLCDDVFRPFRGLWFLSGYVLSREGAQALLEAMPVIGPVDMWMNYRFEALGALAISRPAILQRRDAGSDNSYSILPYLARAGIVDASSESLPFSREGGAPILAWSGKSRQESLAMALSMLGLRVRAFDGNEPPVRPDELRSYFDSFDVLIDATISPAAMSEAIALGAKFIVQGDDPYLAGRLKSMPQQKALLCVDGAKDEMWKPLCAFLGLPEPVQPFPLGADRARDRRPRRGRQVRRSLTPLSLGAGLRPPRRRARSFDPGALDRLGRRALAAAARAAAGEAQGLGQALRRRDPGAGARQNEILEATRSAHAPLRSGIRNPGQYSCGKQSALRVLGVACRNGVWALGELPESSAALAASDGAKAAAVWAKVATFGSISVPPWPFGVIEAVPGELGAGVA